MNSKIDLTTFQGRAATSSLGELVSPPRRIFARVVVPLAVLLGFAAVFGYAAREAIVPAVAVEVVQPVTGSATAAGAAQPSGAPMFQAPAWVEPDPYPIHIAAQTDGIVRQIHVLEGEQVTSGTVIAELIDEDARLQVAELEADIIRKDAELAAAKSNWQNPTTLKEAVMLAEASIAQLNAEKTKAEHQLALAKRQATIDKQLNQRGGIGSFPAEKAAIEARSAEIAIAETSARIAGKNAELQAAREKLSLRIEDKQRLALAEADVKLARAALASARYRLSQRTITAPTSGTIMKLHAAPGSMVSAEMEHGTRIASMYDPEKLQVRAEIPLADVSKIEPDMPAEIEFEALPGRKLKGRITRVIHEADVQRNTLPVKVRIENPDPALKPEMIARVQFLSPARPQQETQTPDRSAAAAGLFIPNEIAGDKDEGEVWVAGADGKAHRKQVKFGRGRQGDLREVLEGLTPADKIIVQGTERLKEGTPVRIKEVE